MATDATIPHGDGAHGAVAETFLGLGSTGWLAVAFLVFVLLLWRLGAFRALVGALDAQADRVRAALAEAEALKAEAERLRQQAAAEAAEAEAQARAIIAQAEAESGRIVAKALADAEAAVQRRRRLAEERIEAARRSAEDALRRRVAELSARAAAGILEDEAGAGHLRHLTDEAIAALDRR